MSEIAPFISRTAQVFHNEELWQTLLGEEQKTKDKRNASKALRFFAFLAKHADVYVDGKVKTVPAIIGIAVIVLPPFILTNMGYVDAAKVTSGVTGAAGWAAFTERKLPVVSKSENAANKLIANLVVGIKKSKINEGDVSRILMNLPKVPAKSPEEIRSWLTNSDQEKMEDPYVKVAKAVNVLIDIKGKYGSMKTKHRNKMETEETVRLMLEGQIKVQQDMRAPTQIMKEGIRMGANAGVGVGVGIVVSMIINSIFGTQFGGVGGLIDDGAMWIGAYRGRIIETFLKAKDKVISSKQKFSTGWEKTQKKLQKARDFLSKS